MQLHVLMIFPLLELLHLHHLRDFQFSRRPLSQGNVPVMEYLGFLVTVVILCPPLISLADHQDNVDALKASQVFGKYFDTNSDRCSNGAVDPRCLFSLLIALAIQRQ